MSVCSEIRYEPDAWSWRRQRAGEGGGGREESEREKEGEEGKEGVSAGVVVNNRERHPRAVPRGDRERKDSQRKKTRGAERKEERVRGQRCANKRRKRGKEGGEKKKEDDGQLPMMIHGSFALYFSRASEPPNTCKV